MHANAIRRCVALAALALAALFVFAACGGDDDGDGENTGGDAGEHAARATPSPFPFEVTRSDGKRFTVEDPATRIVSLSPGATEIIYAIGAQGGLWAVDMQADYPEAAKNFSLKIDAYQPNIETIRGLEPDLVIVADNTGGIVEELDRLELPVLYNDLDDEIRNIDEVFSYITLLGRVTGQNKNAADLVASLETRLQSVRQRMEDVTSTGPRVYHELDESFFSVAEDTFIGSIYKELKAENIAGDGGGTSYPQLTQEKIIADNPQVIVLADEEFGVTVESVKARPGWDAIDAVRNGRIYPVDPDIISRPGPRIVDALEQLARQFYPEAFS